MSARPSATDAPGRRRASAGRGRSSAARDWFVAGLLFALSVVPLVAGTARLLSFAGDVPTSPDNARFFAAPAPVVLHILSASLFSVVGAFQFGGEFRRRWPLWHRASGRLLVPAGLVAALTGLWMTQFYPPGVADGEAVYLARLLVGTAMAACLVLGFVSARRREFEQHRAWMVRAYALGMGAGTQVLTHLPWFLLVGPADELARSVLMIAAWAINLAVAEWVIRRPAIGAWRAASSASIPKFPVSELRSSARGELSEPIGGSTMSSWITAAFLGPERRLRNGWWLAAFFGVLAMLLLPTIIASAHLDHEVTMLDQAILILLATVVVQAMRRDTLWEVTGRLNLRWALHLGLGAGLGACLMLVPALFLWFGGWVDWRPAGFETSALWSAVLLMAGVAVAEELLFRGVLFQRLIAGVGVWPAQLIVAALFVLTHLNNPGMEGATRVWAGVNIFAASILFGLAYVRTRSLALPIGLHFMANVTQGVILGFGVSGASEPSLLAPEFVTQSAWLTGGAFGLEASLPGLLAVLALLLLLAFGWCNAPREEAGGAGGADASAPTSR